ncbi:tryptophan--tRNA ligase [Ignicoccus hospitalis]|uniref:Tryptophan--tRNA ligase n=1 Tax=Ignicoccus hospitalis (strain KIN4/I / DSM 18386 / JCM 14125) TaxID=453591 RepID=A8AC25_IGNH4|nr:tryptophan--tRNA ligase [Ignicoccus hospitalis]ABU82477.1 tryptophanyl-tRNA synthetase [Ignicoccus hospitalis KIN4/I]HIH90572.1 tryptophan--tRNA ligase [Desulfurococcaceae archaeon]
MNGDLQKSTDYDRLIKVFGVTPLSEEVLNKLPERHKLFEIGYFFAHRDFDKVLEGWERGEEFAILTGRGPSNVMHLGHMLLFDFVAWMQKTFKVPAYIPLSDDEKYVFLKVDSLREAAFYAYDNALDIAALGFDEKKTYFFISTKTPEIYEMSVELSTEVTLNEVKAVFGFTDSDNPGKYFYSVVQSAHILFPTVRKGYRSLVPIAIDQDPYIRLSRDIAERKKLPKPAALHSKYLPGLTGEPMSASKPETAIFLDDPPKVIKEKIWKALTGGQPTVKEQREKGGDPERCVVFKWLEAFVLDPKEAEEWKGRCRRGEVLCGECKKKLYEGIVRILKEHHERKLKLADKADKFFLHPVDWGEVDKVKEKTKRLLEQFNLS